MRHSAPDLARYTGKGFPGDWDSKIAATPVKGIDHAQALSMVLLCPETEAVLYGPDFSPRRIRYQRGTRPELERIAATLGGDTAATRARAAMAWVAANVRHPHVVGPVAPDRALTEEGLIASGYGWCNEQARVFIALCEVMEIPARVCFLFHANGVSGHTTAEALVENRWAFFDVTFNLAIARPDGRLAEGRELSGALRELAHRAYKPALEVHYRRILPFVENSPGWNRQDRPAADGGGDLFDVLGLCNYLIDGVCAVPPMPGNGRSAAT